MGWLWGSNDDSSNKPSPSDPLANVDPSLRDFLQKEAPSKYQSIAPAKPEPAESPTDDTTPKKHPNKSLYKDGRYDHLWATYKPQSEIEAVGKSANEKMQDLIVDMKSRKAALDTIAKENCSFENTATRDCYRDGTLAQKMTMCRAETRAYIRCFEMQRKFLQALGYMSAEENSLKQNIAIQMHADTLYQKMLEQERLVAKAKEKGEPIPQFSSLFNDATSVPGFPNSEVDELVPLMKRRNAEKYKDLSPQDRDIEARVAAMEVLRSRGAVKVVQELRDESLVGTWERAKAKRQKEAEERKAAGKPAPEDKLSKWLGF